MDDWLRASAGDLGRGIAAGDIDPEALCDTYLSAIAVGDPDRQVYARTTEVRARAEAEAAARRARSGTRKGVLDGVPISWKDLFDTAGIATEAGSALLKGRTPDLDAPVVARASQGGSVCLGKTHMSELAFAGLGLNPVTATPPGRHDPKAVPGGSSSGAAASVAFGLAPLAIGSDTGGSVRTPAAWNDLVGLKTTHGRLPNDGVVPLCETFDTIGPLARNVEDCALALALLEGTHPADLADATLDGARLLTLADYSDSSRDGPRKAFEAAEARLRDAGASIERKALACVDEAMALSPLLYAPEAYAIWGETIEADPEAMFAPVRERFRAGRQASAVDVLRAWRKLRALRADYARETAGYDAVIVPSVMSTPPDRDRLLSDTEFYVEENLACLRNTRIGNLMGLCALTLPTGVPSCGIMLMAAPMAEERLLRLGSAAERALA
ncbi:amidase [Jannaschia aquimarina]|uniref:GatA_2 protein n=1 Tax=Jannaschia aquimarina TaxID=935700 RepID=A0A0D1ELT1_9RHOB|nr:amidase [Jannaschia aquimarina]KIT16705.1 Glutamyl-tRNA(Gln) amidotransferase subunit A [Jannaschia aquimarina]SNS54609.1 aspartyl-tRNA(Asn)/glutamyl-tRNA(Gln) amidotransferase subunit A [Jannaschia aquimarina]